jgi:hypothetical protein
MKSPSNRYYFKIESLLFKGCGDGKDIAAKPKVKRKKREKKKK